VHKSIYRQNSLPDQIVEGVLNIADNGRRDPLTRYAVDTDGPSLSRRPRTWGMSEVISAELWDPFLDNVFADKCR
jgi:hypothetical protein